MQSKRLTIALCSLLSIAALAKPVTPPKAHTPTAHTHAPQAHANKAPSAKH